MTKKTDATKPSIDAKALYELIEGIGSGGYAHGQVAGLEEAVGRLLVRSGELYGKRCDYEAKLYREVADWLKKITDEERVRFVNEFKPEVEAAWKQIEAMVEGKPSPAGKIREEHHENL